KRTEQDLAEMSNALEKFRSEMDSNQADCCTDLSFHSALASASKNPIAVMVWPSLSGRLSQLLSQTVALPNVPEESYRDHLKIFQTVKEGNPRKARRAMRLHLENADRIWRLANQTSGQCEQNNGHRSGGDSEVASSSQPFSENAYTDNSHKYHAATHRDGEPQISG